jgi:hypothetical protein
MYYNTKRPTRQLVGLFLNHLTLCPLSVYEVQGFVLSVETAHSTAQPTLGTSAIYIAAPLNFSNYELGHIMLQCVQKFYLLEQDTWHGLLRYSSQTRCNL